MSTRSRTVKRTIHVQSGDIIVAGSSAIKSGCKTILKALPVAGVFAFLQSAI